MILDTNAVSALAEGDPDIEGILTAAPSIFIPSVVVGEFLYGIGQSRDRTKYEAWLQRTLGYTRLLFVELRTAREYAAIRLELRRSGRPIPANDLWIAALAREHAMPVISRDKHFDFVPGLERVGW